MVKNITETTIFIEGAFQQTDSRISNDNRPTEIFHATVETLPELPSKNLPLVTAQKATQPDEAIKFIDRLAQSLDPNLDLHQIESLNQIINSLKTQPDKTSILSVKNQVIDVLKTLDKSNLNNLKKIKTPNSFENVIELSEIYREIKEINFDSEEWKLRESLHHVSTALTQMGEFDRAIQFADSITNKPIQGFILRSIITELLKAGKTKDALKLVDTIDHEWYRDAARRDIAEALVEEGSFEEGIALAESILDYWLGEIARGNICEILIQHGKIDRAIEVADSIVEKSIQGFALWNICKNLTSLQRFDQAIWLTQFIYDKKVQSSALWDICKDLTQAKKFDQAIQVTDLILDQWTQSSAQETVSKALAQDALTQNGLARNEQFKKAIELARSILDKEIQALTLWEISKNLAQAKKFEEATQLAESIFDEEIRRSALLDICKDMTRNTSLQDLLTFIQMTSNQELQTFMGKAIAKEFIQTKEFREAVIVAQLLSNEKSRIALWVDICNDLVQNNQPRQEAIRLANSISNLNVKNFALAQIEVQAEDFKQAGKFAKLISHKELQATAQQNIEGKKKSIAS